MAPANGRFRSFLLASLNHYIANEWDRARAQKRGGGLETISLDDAGAEALFGVEPADPLARGSVRLALGLDDRCGSAFFSMPLMTGGTLADCIAKLPGKMPLTGRMEHDGEVILLGFSRDQRLLASGTLKGTVYIWNAHNGELVTVLRHHRECISALQFSPDSRILATASHDHTTRWWSVEDWRPLHDIRHGGVIRSLSFSPGNGRVVSASDDGTARMWDVTEGREVGAPLRHPAAVGAAE